MSRHFGGSGPVNQSDRSRVILLLILFVLLILSGFVVVYLFTAPGETQQQSTPVEIKEEELQIKMAEVLVPVQQIQPGMELVPEMFRIESRPAVSITGRAVKSYEAIQGHFAKSLIVPGQPLYLEYITPERPVNTLTASIPEGFRAVTIRVDQRSSVEGWARPGARVDVVWASRIRGQPGVTIIVENAKVLSAERITAAAPEDGMPVPSTVTLLISAKDAAKIQLASTTGSLSLSLRGDDDTGARGGEGNVGSITIDDLLGRKSSEEVYGNTVTIDGQEWYLKKGKLVPVPKAKGSAE